MRLAPGRMLSHFEILGPLGAGGMGVVYRARDTRLEREVALKVLPEVLVENEEHLARFEREAKLLASLNHPNVATIYGVDHVDGIWFITLELVPGETLKDRLAKGPLPVTEAFRIAREVAAGLQAAHEKGIVHRDLKPANIIVRPDGHVKILDFGLAKRTDVADQPEAEPLTKQFQVMGTPGYLSPEQARGEETDQRADVWAFGCVLYECLAGTRAFPGTTVAESIRAIFEEAPDLEALPPGAIVRLLVSRCLSKDSSTRLRDIGDVKLLLQGALDEPTTQSGPIVITRDAPRTPSRIFAACLVVALLAAGTLAFLLMRRSNGSPPAGGAVALALPYGAELGWRETSAGLSKLGRGSRLLAVSPDGTRVAYCAKNNERSAIYIHVADELDAVERKGTEYGRAPFFSPDGESVGFLVNDSLEVMPVRGGTPRRICNVKLAPNFSACWTGERIIYATRRGLRMASPDGDDLGPLTEPDPERGEIEHLDPSPLPDGEHVLFTVATGTKSRVAMVSLAKKTWDTVVPDAASARYSSGHLVYAQGASIWRVAFDPESPGERGAPEPVRDGVYVTPCAGGGSAVTHYDVARDGTLVYAPATEQPTLSIAYLIDRGSEGIGTEIDRRAGDWKHPRIAPDGGRFALDILQDTGTKDVHVYVFGTGFEGQLTHDGISIMSAWAPGTHGATVRFTHEQGKLREFPRPDDGRPLLELDGVVYADSWTRDGQTVLLTRKRGKDSSLWAYTRGEESHELFDDQDRPRFARLSPDGRWLAYVADVQERPEVFVRPYPALDYWRKISREGGGGAPVWSKSTKELFYRKPDGTIVTVTYETEPEFEKKEETRLFRNDYDADPDGHQHYDVTEDGRFLMFKNVLPAPDRIHRVANAIPRR